VRRRLPPLLLALLVALLALLPASAQALDRAALRSSLGTLAGRMGASAGAYVVDLGTGEPLFARNENLALAPASNEKLFTTSTALLRFGPAGTLNTELRPGPGATVDPDGVLTGDLYLVGGGDPTLGDAGLGVLADQLVADGVTDVDGAVIGDESFFDTLRGGPDSAYRPDYDLGGWLSALSYGHGRAGGGGPTGPARAAATRLAALLKARKVSYERKPRAGTLAASQAASADALATLPSPPMRDLIAATNIPSENFYAEMLLKALGAHYGANGSTAAGVAVVRATMATFGVHPRLTDGSGLSRLDRTTPRQVVRLLQRMDGQDTATTWRASLPVAGRSGTLRKRMRSTAAAGRCAAKTGTLIGVSALSGYCTTTGGVRLAFSFLENRVCASCAKKVEDRMVSVLARLDA
jgi:D-alanyl-D-alanine carboxypeptidase/D-alanyl-D-alanine-endopeptidase (penicillin-binding protein 4)